MRIAWVPRALLFRTLQSLGPCFLQILKICAGIHTVISEVGVIHSLFPGFTMIRMEN